MLISSLPLTPQKQLLTFIQTLTQADRQHGENIRTFCWQGFPDNTEEAVRRERFVVLKGDATSETKATIEKEIRMMMGANKEGFCISLATQEMGVGLDFSGRRRKANVSRIRAQVVDIDKWITEAAITEIIELTQPTMVVLTSSKATTNLSENNESENNESETHATFKAHFYFLYDSKFETELSVSLDRFELIQLILAARVEEIIGIENACDSGIGIEKALRAPGFIHQKDPENLFISELYWCDPENTVGDLDTFFEKAGVTQSHIEIARERKIKEREARQKAREIYTHALTRQREGADVVETNELLWDSNLDSYEGVSEGNRQLSMKHFITGLVLIQGFNYQPALALALAANAKNDPPLDNEEVENLVDYFVEAKMRELAGAAKDRYQGGAGPISTADRFRAVAVPASVIREIEEREAIPDYDYSDRVAFSDFISDVSIMERLSQRHGRYIRANKKLGVVIYKEESGCFVEDEGHVGYLIDEVISKMPEEECVRDCFIKTIIDKETKERVTFCDRVALSKWVGQNRSMSKRKPRISAISGYKSFIEANESFDAYPQLINSPSGVIDLTNGQLMDHDPEFLLTRSLAYRYHPDSFERWMQLDTEDDWINGNAWTKFIYEVMEGNLSMCRFLQRSFGYTLYGHLSEQVLWFFYGSGENGKSLCLETILAIMGDYGAALDNGAFLEKKQGSDNARLSSLAAMRGVRFALANEINKGDKLNEGAVKDVTTGAPITAKFSHQNSFTYKPQFTSFLHGNNQPKIEGTDRGIWRRLLTVPFNVNFEGRTDKQLSKTLLVVGDEILSWMVAGSVQYAYTGLMAPQAVMVANQEYRDEMHPEERFFRECLTTPGAEDSASILTTIDILRALKVWWTETSQLTHIPTPNSLGRFLGRKAVTTRVGNLRGYYLKWTPAGQEFYTRTSSSTSSLFQ